MRTLKLAAVSASLLALTGCGPMLYAEVEVPEMCELLPEQEFQGLPIAVHGTVSQTLDYAIGEALGVVDGLETEANLLHATITPGAGMNDFGFIDAATIEMVGAEGSALPAALVLQYERGANSPAAALELTGSSVDLLPYLADGKLRLRTSLTGSLPTQAWKANVQTCVNMRAKYNYGEQL